MSIAPSKNPLEVYLQKLITLTELMLTLDATDVGGLESHMNEREVLVQKIQQTAATSAEKKSSPTVKAMISQWQKLDETLEKRFLEIRAGLAKGIHQNTQTKKVISGYRLGQQNAVNLGIENEA
jgi:hypothetical protein